MYTSITGTGRVDEQRFAPIAMRELVVNAIVHNDYRGEGLPTFEEFSTRFEISSFGGLPEGFTQQDFLNGYSLPVNPELIRVFRDLGFAERLGTGIRRVLKFYPKEIFRFSPSFLRVSIPLKAGAQLRIKTAPAPKTVLDAIRVNPSITRSELSALLNVSESTVYREITNLKDKGLIRRVGETKGGYWEIIGPNEN
ncbi:MAG: winged helix-turn-helix transcriptional regulator [Bacilli bacterium]|nr:winged helix-turn-helix transcriptional regulator [Bacilli bacterium]